MSSEQRGGQRQRRPRAQFKEGRYRQGNTSERFEGDTSDSLTERTQLVGVDNILVYIILALTALGLTAVYSASAMESVDSFGNSLYVVQKQVIFFVLGYGILYGMSRFPFYRWTRFTKPIAFVVIGLLLYTLANGVVSYGAERWIHIFGISVQPSELGKISVLLLLAQAFSHPQFDKSIASFFKSTVLFNLILIAITLGLIYEQPSLSMTLILAGTSFLMMIISGINLPLLLIGASVGGTVVVLKLMKTEYQMRRIQGWLDPWKDPQDTGYNLIQSLYAIGSGGLIGTGLGMSHQKLYYLPFQYTDFIFSVWAEEWGFIGCVILLGLFFAMLYRGVMIAKACRHPFGQLLAMGITLILGIQVIINVSVATGLFPVTGVTLPLISAGGTSIFVTMFLLGLLLNISRYRVPVESLHSLTRAHGE